MKLVQIAGWLGSGKTTLVIALAKALGRDGLKVAIVVNEIGAVPVPYPSTERSSKSTA